MKNEGREKDKVAAGDSAAAWGRSLVALSWLYLLLHLLCLFLAISPLLPWPLRLHLSISSIPSIPSNASIN